MTKKFTYTQKSTGDALSATEWNNLAQDVDAAVDAINAGSVGGGSSVVSVTDETVSGGDPTVGVSVASGVQEIGSPKVIELTKKSKGVNTTLFSGNNINIEPRESTGKAKGTKGGNISMKPGDDIELCSHHRRFGNRDEVSVKVIDGDDNPVKLQLKTANITLSTEGKDTTKAKDEDTGLDTDNLLYDDPNVMNINVNTGDGKGYLKVRAQAIDLRCEANGGIALQPKGNDGDGHENKIKFEHDGGDGLEFGTFNTEKTSVFTDEYRFNGNGIVYAVTRGTPAVQSYKEDGVTPKKTDYPTQSDDFKDIPLTREGSQCTWDSTNSVWQAPAGEHILSCTWGDIVEYIAWAKANNQGPWESNA